MVSTRIFFSFCLTFKLYICKYVLEQNNPTSIHPFFSGVDLRVENIQLFFHRSVHTGVRDENVGTRTSALREGQVRTHIVQPHKGWMRRGGLTLILISAHTLLHHNFVLI